MVELELDEEPKLQSLDKGNVHSVITMSSEEQSQLLANRFLSLTCPFNLSKDLSLCGLLDMIFEGRKVSDNVIYALLFWIEGMKWKILTLEFVLYSRFIYGIVYPCSRKYHF